MRNLNECRAEVFRRSEMRIKARRQRRKNILLVCLPLVLCISAFSGFVLPAMIPVTSTDNPRQETIYTYMSGAMGTDVIVGLSAGNVTVSGNGISHSYASATDVQRILSLLHRIGTVGGTDDGSESKESFTNAQSTASCQESNTVEEYKICVRWSDGSSTEYLLQGSLLIDQSTQEKFHLGEDICYELKEALGVPLC